MPFAPLGTAKSKKFEASRAEARLEAISANHNCLVDDRTQVVEAQKLWPGKAAC